MRNHPAIKLFEGAKRFLMSDELVDSLGKGNYHGNLIIVGSPEMIEGSTSERYDEIFHKLLFRYGNSGYDDADRLAGALREMGIFDRNEYDRDCALAFSPDYALLGAGRYVENVNTAKLKNSETMRKALEIKGGHINGRHLAGLYFSSLGDDNVAIPMSESGRSIITFNGGDMVPEYSMKVPSPSTRKYARVLSE